MSWEYGLRRLIIAGTYFLIAFVGLTFDVRTQQVGVLVGKSTTITIRDFRAGERWDVFSFVDINDSERRNSSGYGEINPRIRMYGRLHAAGMLESGGVHRAYLYGLAVDVWRVSVHGYRRTGRGFQATVVWNIQAGRFRIDGFHDYANIGTVSQPQFRYQVSDCISAGVEIQYHSIGAVSYECKFVLRIAL